MAGESHYFEGFILDLKRGCLRTGNREVELRPKSFALLCYMVDNAGRLLSKDELIGAVWPDVVVTDESLTRCVSDLRQALQDQAQRIIKTVPRRGYLFAATISRPPADSSPAERGAAPASHSETESPSPAEGPALVAPRDEGGEGAPAHGPVMEPRSAERRQLTVLTCELVGLAALSTQLDLDELQEVTTACHRRCTEIIERHRGYVVRCAGDSVLAYFGYLQAQEYEAERSVQAGLALAEALPKLALASGPPLAARVGIATGMVVIGDVVPTKSATEPSVVGGTPNLAAQLQALAEPGAVVISSGTHDLTGGLFDYRDLGPVVLKGLTEPVPAWQVLGASTADSRFEALREVSTPLVNRDEEIDLFLRRWESVKDGEGAVILLSGEPGIGKSRIAETVLELLSDDPHARVRYYCSPHHQDSALYPLINQLERAAGFRRGDTDEQRIAKLEAAVAAVGTDLGEVMPLFADLLAIPRGDRYPAPNLPAAKQKEKIRRALVAHIEAMAAQQPVLVLCEDVHWSDPTTLEVLDLLVDRVARMRTLVIMTFRPEYTAPWTGRSQVTLISLNRLTPRQRTEMIARITGDKLLPKEIADEIVDRTDGVPLFVEELTKSVVESGQLVASGGRYVVRGPAAPLAIPTSLQASLLARLDRLAATRSVVQTAAALGRQFSHELISAVATMPQDQLNDGLERLVRAELIFRRGMPPDAEYTFKHALVQDAAYDTMLRGQRQQRHAQIASALEEHFPEVAAAEPALLARHCTEGGLDDKAVVYWLKAGRQALARSAMREAVARLRKGLDVLSGLPDGSWRWQHELDLQMALRPALSAINGSASPEVGETIDRARALAERLGRADYLATLSLGQWLFHLVRSELRQALAIAEQIEKIGTAQKIVAMQLQGRRALGLTRQYLGEFVAARALLEQCHGLRDPAHRVVAGGMLTDVYVQLLGELAETSAYLGNLEEARLRLNEGLSEARRLGHVATLTSILVLGCRLEWMVGSPDLMRHAEEMWTLANEHGIPLIAGWAAAFRGASLTALGQAQEGLRQLTQGMATIRAIGWLLNTPELMAMLASAHLALGQTDEGLKCIAEGEHLVETTEERKCEAELHRLRGDLLEAGRDPAAAEQSYRRALAVARAQSAKLPELRASLSLARLLHGQDKYGQVHELLGPICAWFAQGSNLSILDEAKALLRAPPE